MTTAPDARASSPPSPLRLLLPLGAALVLSLTGDQTLYATLATQTDVVGISVAAVGVMLGVNRIVRVPGNPLGGALIDRLGRRRPFILGMFLGTLSTASYAFVHGPWPLLAARMLWGVSWVLINISGLSMILDITTPTNRGRITGLFQMCYLLGLTLAASLGGFLVDAIGFRRALLICACATTLGLLIALFGLPETAPRIRQHTIDWTRFRPASWLQESGRAAHAGLRHIDRRFLTVALMYMITNFANNGVLMSTASLLLKSRFGASVTIGETVFGVASLSGLLLGLRSFLAMLTGPIAGHLSDSPHGRWRVISWGFAVGTIGFCSLAVDGQLWLITLGIALMAISAGTLFSTMAAQAGDLTRARNQGAMMGLYATGGDAGSAIGPIFAYTLATLFDLRWVYLLCAALFVTGLGFTWLVRRLSSESDNLPQK